MAANPSIGRAVRIERPASAGSDATRDLYERFAGQIYGYCLHQLGSREEAEDAVQTTFMNAFRGLQRGIVPQVESAWLFKIAHNVCLSRRRSTWRRGKIEAPNNLEVLQEVVPAREQSGDELIRLPEVLEDLPESQRRAILLREWQGLSYREIAEELGLSQSAVETLIFRARRALATGLEEQPQETSWRKRVRHGVDAGGMVAALKALFTGGTAVKVAATVAVATTTAALAASDAHQHVISRQPAAARHHVLAPRTVIQSTTTSSVTFPPRHQWTSPPVQRNATPKKLRAAPTGAAAARNDAPTAVTPARVVSPPEPADAPPAAQPKPEEPPRATHPAHSSASPANPGKGHAKQPPAVKTQPDPPVQPAETREQGAHGNPDKPEGAGHK